MSGANHRDHHSLLPARCISTVGTNSCQTLFEQRPREKADLVSALRILQTGSRKISQMGNGSERMRSAEVVVISLRDGWSLDGAARVGGGLVGHQEGETSEQRHTNASQKRELFLGLPLSPAPWGGDSSPESHSFLMTVLAAAK